MKPHFSHIALLLCILLHLGAQAQDGAKSLFGLATEGDTALRLTFEAGSFAIVADGGHATLAVDGLAQRAAAEGLPALPQLSRLVALPRGSELRLKDYHCGEALRLPVGGEPLPWQGATTKETERPWVPLAKELGEAVDAVTVENLGAMGDRQMFRITVCPAQYDPTDNSYSLTRSIEATLNTEHSSLNTEHSTLNTEHSSLNTEHSTLNTEHSTLNTEHSPLNTEHSPLTTAQKLLVVSRPVFRQGLQDYVQWKRQEGYVVEELYADTNKRDSVKALIAPFFADATPLNPAPSHILIVGDAAQIQAFVGGSRPEGLTTHSTDLYYAEHTGDWLPDAFVGRWPVNDTAELGAVVRKTLRYEQCRDIDTAALRRAIVVAGSESRTPAPTTTNGQANYVSRQLKSLLPEADTLCFRNPASASQTADILGAIDDGAALLSYTAHCTVGGWSSPSVTFSSIDTLEGAQPMVYVNNCCRSNDFSGTCFGEQLLRKPDGGAIGVIGATNETLWEEDYYWAVGPKYPLELEPAYDSLRPGAFDRLFGGGMRTMGEMLHAGNLAVMASGTRFSRFYWEIYCLLGDPTLMPRLGAVQPLWLSGPDSIELGATEVRVGSTPGATVAATQGARLLGAARCEDNGGTLLPLEAVDDTTPITITATGPQMVPATITVGISMPHGRAAMLHGTATTDTSVAFSLTNTGTDTLVGLLVGMTPDSLGATYSTADIVVDTLLPQAAIHLTMAVDVTRWERWWGGTLTATDSRSGDTLCRTAVAHWLHDTLPTLAFTIATADGRRIDTLGTDAEYLLTATASGPFDSLSLAVTAYPANDTIADTTLLFPLSTLISHLSTPHTRFTHLLVRAYIHRGNYVRQYSYYLEAGGRTPSSGSVLGCYPWRNEEPQPWFVDSTAAHSGAACLRSGGIDYRQQSDLWLDVLLPQADSIVFWAKSSTEPQYDKLTFEVDGTVRKQLWGEYDWRRYTVPLSAGSHTLRWHYHKDDADDAGSDCVWLDDIRIPLALWNAPYGCPGNGREGITAPAAGNTTLLFPNPAGTTVSIATKVHGTVTAELVDTYGRTVCRQRLNADGTASMDIHDIHAGVYILLLHHGTGTERHKLIIQH